MDEVTKKDYYDLKARGLCVRCGKNKAREGRVMCSTCAEKVNAYRTESIEWAREHNVCPKCMKNKLFGDEKTCPECLANQYARNRRSVIKLYETSHNQYVLRMKRKKEQGICRSCNNKIAEGHTYCSKCLTKKRERSKHDRLIKGHDGIDRSERYYYGLCYRCGEPLDTDKRLCSKCCSNVVKNFKGIRGTNTYWKVSNRLLGGAMNG